MLSLMVLIIAIINRSSTTMAIVFRVFSIVFRMYPYPLTNTPLTYNDT